MAGGGQEEEEGDAMNGEKGPEVEHEDDSGCEAEPSPAKRGSKGRGRIRVRKGRETEDSQDCTSPLPPPSHRRPQRSPW